MKILTIRLEGAMQSWGNSEFGVRSTEDIPTQSGVIGIIGSAMGYSRENPEFLSLMEPLTTAFRIDRKGSKMRDYQTVTVSKKGQKVQKKLVDKIYLSDASFLCAIYDPDGQSDELLEKIKDSLIKPSNSLYLGRRSCPPSTRVFDGLDDFDGVLEAFETIDATQAIYSPLKPYSELEVWLPGNEGKSPRLIKDIPVTFSSNRKTFTSRIISKHVVKIPNREYNENLATTTDANDFFQRSEG